MERQISLPANPHPFLTRIIDQLRPKDKTDLIISPEAALPFAIDSSFDRTFMFLEQKARLVTSQKQLDEIAQSFVTCTTKDEVVVYNNERYPARIKKHTRHTTPLRDVEITNADLENMKTALVKLPENTPIYKMYVKAGAGTEQHWFELYFTPEGSKLAQVAAIMMNASFEKPDGVEIDGRYFAMPEYQDITGNQNPLELIYMNDEGKTNIFVGGTTYPGDIYKPICKAMNAWVYMHGGVEIHAGAVVLSYKDPASGERKKKVQIISGLSLHGKTTLATAKLMDVLKQQFVQRLDTSVERLELKYELLHDDYVFLKVDDSGLVEIGSYAPNGIFPAMFGEDAEGLIATNPKTILFNTFIETDGRPNFKAAFPFVPREGETKPTKNLRAAAPIEALGMEVVKHGFVVDTTDISIINLTRDPDAPSVCKWQNPDDVIKYWAGLVVVPTDATVEKAGGSYLNYMCTDFDVAPRGPYMARLKHLWQKIEAAGKQIAGYTVNTGAPEKEESVAAVQSILLGLMPDHNLVSHDQLGILYAQDIPALPFAPYIPWQIYPEVDFVGKWRKRQKQREEFFKERQIDLEKAGLTPTSLV